MQNALVISASGLVVWSASPPSATRGGLWGALLRSLIELSVTATGGAATLTHLSFASGVDIALHRHPDAPLYCAVFLHSAAGGEGGGEGGGGGGGGGGGLGSLGSLAEREVGPAVGALLARALLSAFVDEHGGEVEGAAGHSTAAFRPFTYRLPSILRDASRSLLRASVMQWPGVRAALLVGDDGTADSVHAEGGEAPRRDVDDVAVIATVRPLLAAAMELGEGGGGGGWGVGGWGGVGWGGGMGGREGWLSNWRGEQWHVHTLSTQH
jgi:hypothetical protein